jgi:hypothetical protein
LRILGGVIPVIAQYRADFVPTIVEVALQILSNPLLDIPAFPGLLDSHRKQQQQREFAAYWAVLSSDTVQDRIHPKTIT